MYGEICMDQTNLQRFISMRDMGTELNSSLLDKEVLTQLWADDLATDYQISQVFNCTPFEVKQLRERYGVNHVACVKRYISNFGHCLGSIGVSIMSI